MIFFGCLGKPRQTYGEIGQIEKSTQTRRWQFVPNLESGFTFNGNLFHLGSLFGFALRAVIQFGLCRASTLVSCRDVAPHCN